MKKQIAFMDKEYHTLNEGIPPVKEKRGGNTVGMDTGNNRQWLHLWIGHHEKVKVEGRKTKRPVFVSQSVHLSRQDALNLIEEIQHRLF